MRYMISKNRSYEQKTRDIEFGVKGLMPYFDQKRLFITDAEREVVYNVRKGIAK